MNIKGYNGYSMSDRAVEAYNNGEKPISKWTKKEIISAIARQYPKKAELFAKIKLSVLRKNVLFCSSWHHTSKNFNRTDFYTIDEEYIEQITDDEIRNLSSSDDNDAKNELSTKYKGTIFYLEWSGSRKYPKAKEMCLENVNIEERGCFYYITDDTGKELLKKKIGSNGTRVINYTEEEKRKKEREKKEQNIRKLSSDKALKFYDDIKYDCEYSQSGHIYKRGRKHNPYDYDNGLKSFFRKGEHRLFSEFSTGVLHLETWDGERWVTED